MGLFVLNLEVFWGGGFGLGAFSIGTFLIYFDCDVHTNLTKESVRIC